MDKPVVPHDPGDNFGGYIAAVLVGAHTATISCVDTRVLSLDEARKVVDGFSRHCQLQGRSRSQIEIRSYPAPVLCLTWLLRDG